MSDTRPPIGTILVADPYDKAEVQEVYNQLDGSVDSHTVLSGVDMEFVIAGFGTGETWMDISHEECIMWVRIV